MQLSQGLATEERTTLFSLKSTLIFWILTAVPLGCYSGTPWQVVMCVFLVEYQKGVIDRCIFV